MFHCSGCKDQIVLTERRLKDARVVKGKGKRSKNRDQMWWGHGYHCARYPYHSEEENGPPGELPDELENTHSSIPFMLTESRIKLVPTNPIKRTTQKKRKKKRKEGR